MKPVSITKKIEFDAGHRIPNHKSKCRNMHGHRYVVEVTLKGEINDEPGSSDQGMVIDFTDVKAVLTEHVHDVYDHAFLVWEKDTVVLDLLKNLGPSHKHVVLPEVPTVENLVQIIYSRLDLLYRGIYGSRLALVNVKVYETPTSWAQVSTE